MGRCIVHVARLVRSIHRVHAHLVVVREDNLHGTLDAGLDAEQAQREDEAHDRCCKPVVVASRTLVAGTTPVAAGLLVASYKRFKMREKRMQAVAYLPLT